MTIALEPQLPESSNVSEVMEGNYYVAAYPPFSCWTEGDVSQALGVLATDELPADQTPWGLYVHIPFCAERCDYCYYRAYTATSHAQITRYLEGILQELALYQEASRLTGRKPAFVYFGGGTPSLLSVPQIEDLLRKFQAAFPWDAAREVTFECAPKSVTRRKLAVLQEAGVTRISLGIQQLDDRVLAANGRTHSVADALRAYEAIQSFRFPTVNVDLIVGMLGETAASFERSLDTIIGMQPDSVTIYQLELPRNTPLTRRFREGSLESPLPSWSTKRARLDLAFDALERAGYTVQTAYAALRDPRRHLFVYQDAQYRGADVVGMGVSSFSYVGGVHYQNADSSSVYRARLESGSLPIVRAYALDAEERLVREFVLQLKLGGVSLRKFRRKFGVDVADRFAEPLQHFADRGWLRVDRDEESIRLTRQGLVRVDHLLSSFYLPQHRELPYW
jgi:oxygen-independent coproporphyrinogen-3 oxidase